jgi:hypothetical protein
MTDKATSRALPKDLVELFKLYETGAEKAKERAWTSATWVLSLNAAILAFDFDFFQKSGDKPVFVIVEVLSALVGVGLCFFLVILLKNFGDYIRHYWTSSNKIAAMVPWLEDFIGLEEAAKARIKAGYKAEFPSFCRYLQILTGAFAAVHIGAAVLLVCHAAQ